MRIALMLALALAATGTASALPGQTAKQLAAWGKSNVALLGFKKTFDQNTAGDDYQAHVKVDGFHGMFSSEPVNGVVPHEYISFQDTPDTWHATSHLNVVNDALAVVYGNAVANDFKNATRQKSTVAIWKGKLYAYSTFGAAVFVMRLSDLKDALKNAHDCGALDCAGD